MQCHTLPIFVLDLSDSFDLVAKKKIFDELPVIFATLMFQTVSLPILL